MKRVVPAIFAIVFLSSCTTSFTNMTPTKALDPLDAEVSLRGQVSAHGSVVRKTLESGRDARDVVLDRESEEPITEEQLQNFLDAGLAWLLFRPGVNFELSARLGIWELLEGIDIGLRYDFTTIKGDVKLQFWESDDEQVAISALAGVGKQTVPVPGIVEWLTLTEFKRTDFDFMLSVGWELPDIFKAYFNPRLMVSRIKLDTKLPAFVEARIPEEVMEANPLNELFQPETMLYYGATAGMMAGYKYAFLAMELTVLKLNFEPSVLGETSDFDSLVVAPSAGLVITW